MPLYTCSECGAEVTVSQSGEITRTCEHADATVYLNLDVVCVGEGGNV